MSTSIGHPQITPELMKRFRAAREGKLGSKKEQKERRREWEDNMKQVAPRCTQCEKLHRSCGFAFETYRCSWCDDASSDPCSYIEAYKKWNTTSSLNISEDFYDILLRLDPKDPVNVEHSYKRGSLSRVKTRFTVSEETSYDPEPDIPSSPLSDIPSTSLLPRFSRQQERADNGSISSIHIPRSTFPPTPTSQFEPTPITSKHSLATIRIPARPKESTLNPQDSNPRPDDTNNSKHHKLKEARKQCSILETQLQEALKAKNLVQDQLSDMQKELQDTQTSCLGLKNELQGMHGVTERLQGQLSALQKEKDTTGSLYTKVNTRADGLQTQLKAAQTQLAATQEERKSLKRQLDEERRSHQEELTSLRNKLKVATELRNKTLNEGKASGEEKAIALREVTRLREELEHTEKRLEASEERGRILNRKQQEHSKSVETTARQHADALKKLEDDFIMEKAKLCSEIEATIPAVKQLQAAEEKTSDAQKEVDRLQKSLKEIEQRLKRSEYSYSQLQKHQEGNAEAHLQEVQERSRQHAEAILQLHKEFATEKIKLSEALELKLATEYEKANSDAENLHVAKITEFTTELETLRQRNEELLTAMKLGEENIDAAQAITMECREEIQTLRLRNDELVTRARSLVREKDTATPCLLESSQRVQQIDGRGDFEFPDCGHKEAIRTQYQRLCELKTNFEFSLEDYNNGACTISTFVKFLQGHERGLHDLTSGVRKAVDLNSRDVAGNSLKRKGEPLTGSSRRAWGSTSTSSS